MRAAVLAAIRQFFAMRAVLEVETPLLGDYSVTAPHVESIATTQGQFLQTSPEYAMKRLLADGSGAIFQVCKAFRRNETGPRHNPEFTILEWYRPGFDHLELMQEVAQLVAVLKGCVAALAESDVVQSPDLVAEVPLQRMSFRDAFVRYLGIDPHQASLQVMQTVAHQCLDVHLESELKNDWLDLLLSHCIEPQLGHQQPLFLHDFPQSQAALAKVVPDSRGIAVAERFELYIKGMEIANGYHELLDAQELQQRLLAEQCQRQHLGFEYRAIDPRFMAAMQQGVPPCAGVALGLDRLLMCLSESSKIDDVLCFPADRA